MPLRVPSWVRPRSRLSEPDQSAMAGDRAVLRALGTNDLDQALRLLDREPVENVFLTQRFEQSGLDPYLLGCQVLGWFREHQLGAVCHVGANLVCAHADDQALAAFVDQIGPRRRVSSLMGRSDQVLPLWHGLSERWGHSWSSTREVRAHQPLMRMGERLLVEPDPRVRVITMDDFEPYFAAAVRMYTEEVGVSPLDPSGSYASHVRRTISQGRAFGIVEDGRVLFKADAGCAQGEVCQVQGVWLADALRGKGLSEPAMAAVVQLCQRRWSVVSLYVNDYNVRARKLYERIGFDVVGEFATVLY